MNQTPETPSPSPQPDADSGLKETSSETTLNGQNELPDGVSEDRETSGPSCRCINTPSAAKEAYKELLAGPVPLDASNYRRLITLAVLIGRVLESEDAPSVGAAMDSEKVLQNALGACEFVTRLFSQPSDPSPVEINAAYEQCRAVLALANEKGILNEHSA